MILPADAIEVKVTEPVGTVVLNRPDRCNALTRAMIAALRDALRDLYNEKAVRAIVITGAGPAFCGGRDAAEMHAGVIPTPEAATPAQLAAAQQRWGEESTEYRDLIVEMLELSKPIIAAVNGPAAAGGAGLVLAADVVLACDDAAFGLPDPRRGVVAGVAGPLLAHRIGAGPAARLLLTAEMIDATEAHRVGVYHEMVATDFLWARAVEIGRGIAAGAPEAVALTKRLLSETIGEQLATQLTSGAIASATARTTESAREGISAFVEKRDPEWR
ncbi:MAG: enoyl-CoA hydratase/isomerase family protein [Planctomycetota bacterium]